MRNFTCVFVVIYYLLAPLYADERVTENSLTTAEDYEKSKFFTKCPTSPLAIKSTCDRIVRLWLVVLPAAIFKTLKLMRRMNHV
jgi:hypothetical protein